MKKWLKILLATVGFSLLLIVIGYFWLTRSEAGARWALNLASSQQYPVLTFKQVKGSIYNGLEMGRIHYQEPGIDVQVKDVAVELDYSFLPLKVIIKQLRVKAITITSSQAASETASEVSDDFSMPMDIELTSVVIGHLEHSDKNLRIIADNTHAALNAGSHIEITQFSSQLSYQLLDATNPASPVTEPLSASLALTAKSELTQPWHHELKLQLIPTISSTNTDPYIQLLNNNHFELSAKGDVRHSILALDSQGQLNFDIQLELRDLLKKINWQLQLHSEHLQLPLTTAEQLDIQQLTIQGRGSLENWQTQGSAELNLTDSQKNQISGHWELNASGNLDNIQISKLGLSGDIGMFDFNGQLNPNKLELEGNLSWQQFAFSIFMPGLASQTTSGSGKIQYSPAAITIRDLQAVIDHSNSRLNANINISDQISAQLQWQALGWPLGTESADFFSQSGHFDAEGSLDNYSLNGQFDLSGAQIPTGRYRIQGQGSKTGLQLQNIDSQILDGTVQLNGQVQWQAPMSAQVNIQGSGINPGIKWLNYPGQLELDAEINWVQASDNGAENLTIKLHQFKGQLRNFPLQLDGSIQLDNGKDLNVDITALNGASTIALKAETNIDQYLSGNADFKFDIPNLGDLIPAAKGRLSGAGKLQTTATGQQLLLDLKGGNIDTSELDLERIDLQMDILLPTNTERPLQIAGRLQASNIRTPTVAESIDSIELKAVQSGPGQALPKINIKAASAANSLDGQLDVNLRIDNNYLQIEGDLVRLDLKTAVTGPLTLQAPAQIKFSQQNLHLLMSPACFRQQPDSLHAEVCFSRVQNTNEKTANIRAYSSRLQLEKFPLAWITSYLPIDIIFSQTISGTANLTGSQNLTDINTADGDFTISPGRIASIDLSEGSLETDAGQLQFSLDPKKALSGQFKLPFQVGTGMNFTFNINQLQELEQAQMQSQLDIDLDDLIALKWLIPGLDDLSGEMVAKMQISGKLAELKVIGDLDIHDVGFTYTPLGMEMSQINLKGEIKRGEKSSLDGSFLAGEGQGRLRLQVDTTSKNTRLSLSLSGQDLQLLNAPDLKLNVSPDIQVNISANTIKLAGNIDIPSARISPLPGMLSSTPISTDVVVSGLDQSSPDTPKELPLLIDGGLKIKLGDDVKFKMDAVKTQLEGELALSFSGKSATPNAKGEIRLSDGYFQQYGQNLEFLDSNIYFDGKSVTNPKLDIYAVRHIFADPEVELAGIHISGRPDNIQLKLYTDPETDQESAVAYIATGSNFDHGNGVGTLNIGTYIYPKLFVSYGVGLFDTGNVVSARYELTKKWAVQGTSSDSESGVDILYSIDR